MTIPRGTSRQCYDNRDTAGNGSDTNINLKESELSSIAKYAHTQTKEDSGVSQYRNIDMHRQDSEVDRKLSFIKNRQINK